jgi:hypothetical protein
LTVFLDAALTKKYTNPSSDIISILAGLHDADAVMTDFVATLDAAIRNGRSSTFMRLHHKNTLTEVSTVAPRGGSSHPLHNRRRLPDSPSLVLHTS